MPPGLVSENSPARNSPRMPRRKPGGEEGESMHEMGIVMHLAKVLDETAEENKITRIGSVTLAVGEVSGIMTDYFEECWDFFKVKSPYLRDAKLLIQTIPAVTWCDHCKREYPTLPYGKECPYCHSAETWLSRGNECIIREITAQ